MKELIKAPKNVSRNLGNNQRKSKQASITEILQCYQDNNLKRRNFLQESTQLSIPNKITSSIQRKTYYKIFETEQEKPVPIVGEGLTKLGVRRTELEIINEEVRGISKGTPQGMSVSDSINEETQRAVSKDNESIFKIEENYFDAQIKVREDPEDSKHFLVGPKKMLSYNVLNKKVQDSKEGWAMAAYQNGDKWKYTGFHLPAKKKRK